MGAWPSSHGQAPGGSGSGMPVNGDLTEAEQCMFINWVKGGAK